MLSLARCNVKAVRPGQAPAPAAPPRAAASGRRAAVARADKPKMGQSGYVEADNSGRGNIFPAKQQARARRAPYMKKTGVGGAVEGVGGIGGLGVIGGVVAVVAAAAVLVLKSGGPESLTQVAAGFEGDSLSVIAQRIERSL
ncbi:MAG: hypothetical protein J3K34DRAFT_516429 [Monoraphidium minutum]|nr:MAG: hypothetical protein J3K34DRAFT_516429 [Monoraphidium minutum]